MRPVFFLDLAEYLAKQANVEDRRSAVSRAYYAIFLGLAEKYPECLAAAKTSKEEKGGIHAKFIRNLTGALPSRKIAEISSFMENRVSADYYMDRDTQFTSQLVTILISEMKDFFEENC